MKLNEKDANKAVKAHLTDYLSAKGIDWKKEFCCLNPAHDDHNPSMGVVGGESGVNCFCLSCGATYDILDLIGLDRGLTGYKDKLEAAAALYGIEVDWTATHDDGELSGSTYQKPTSGTNAKLAEKPAFDTWAAAIGDSRAVAYLAKRGISLETARKYKLGYCRNLKGIEAIVFPTGDATYNARNIKDGIRKDQRYRKATGAFSCFNIKALEHNGGPVFITEGEFDALSILQAGGEAVALGGLANLEKVMLEARQRSNERVFIIALDNDDQGKKKALSLKVKENELEKDGIKLYFPDLESFYNGKKDANEALVENKSSFMDSVEKAIYNAEHLDEQKKQEALLQLKKTSVANMRGVFDDVLEKSKVQPFIPTGFDALDKLLDGGLFPGLYVVGAISSLGKTTLCLQMADQMARAGHDVLIFSLEMSKVELIAKSISRLTSIIDVEQTSSNTSAKTTRGILTGTRYAMYNERELDLIRQAKEAYFTEYAPHLYIYEGMGNVGVETVRKRVKDFMEAAGKAPVVLIDYIQILALPGDRMMTDKQGMDFNIMELKRISRDYETPVVGISSFNRENYTARVNLAAFKESGAIEYSSDVLIGLQYKAMEELTGTNKDKDKAKASEIYAAIAQKALDKRAIEIQCKILKNRNGGKGCVDFDYYPLFNKFKESVV